jgi:molybdenum cofactor cytidylyltransferase/nicotine blue oxidoreductase
VIAGLILAAGAGTRFGDEPKLLADVEGAPVLQHVVDAAHGAGPLERIVVVLGAHADELARRVDFLDAEPVICEDWQEGQSASLRRGLAALADADQIVVLLGDQPLVTAQVIAALVDHGPGWRAAYHGVPGHPAVLGRTLIDAARETTGDRGLRDARWRTFEVGHLAGGRDIDTPEDLEAIRSEARAVLRR